MIPRVYRIIVILSAMLWDKMTVHLMLTFHTFSLLLCYCSEGPRRVKIPTLSTLCETIVAMLDEETVACVYG